MAYLVCYDIENNGDRDKFAKMLLKAGLSRIQLSVFMGNLRPELTAKLSLAIEKKWRERPPSDKCYMIYVPDDNVENARCFGSKPDWPVILGHVKYRVM